MPTQKTLLPITQVDNGVPVLVCNGLHYAVDLTGAIWTHTKPTEGAQDQRYKSSVQLGSWKLEAAYTKTKNGNTTTYTNVTYTESTVNNS